MHYGFLPQEVGPERSNEGRLLVSKTQSRRLTSDPEPTRRVYTDTHVCARALRVLVLALRRARMHTHARPCGESSRAAARKPSRHVPSSKLASKTKISRDARGTCEHSAVPSARSLGLSRLNDFTSSGRALGTYTVGVTTSLRSALHVADATSRFMRPFGPYTETRSATHSSSAGAGTGARAGGGRFANASNLR